MRVNTYSAVMCWVAVDRLAYISHKLGLTDRAQYWDGQALHMRTYIMDRWWHAEEQCISAVLDFEPGSRCQVCASLLLLGSHTRFLDPHDERFLLTVKVRWRAAVVLYLDTNALLMSVLILFLRISIRLWSGI
jgi:GH15 family glucan-1,4-alpha-glucosidase